MEASNISFEQTQLENELEAINFQLDWLYQRGCNDENLVSRKREIEQLFRPLKMPEKFVFEFSKGISETTKGLLQKNKL